ncbi:unnamed protein product, partial [Nesidiocoris tenuis]
MISTILKFSLSTYTLTLLWSHRLTLLHSFTTRNKRFVQLKHSVLCSDCRFPLSDNRCSFTTPEGRKIR